MNLREALDIVLSLAQDNALPVVVGSEEEDEATRQDEALDKVHELLSLLSENSG